MSKARNYFDWQARLVTPHLGKRVLEVGCGTGNFTGALLDRDLVVAIDADPLCVAELTGRFPNQPNLHALVADAADLLPLAHFEFDSAVCLNVLEHVEDHLGALRGMARLLPPGGVVVLLVPAFAALTGPIDHNLGHYRRYRPSMVTSLAADARFHIRSMRYCNALGFFGWWVNAHVLRRESQSTAQIEFFDRFVVPVLSRAEEILRPAFGQSLLAVLERAPD